MNLNWEGINLLFEPRDGEMLNFDNSEGESGEEMRDFVDMLDLMSQKCSICFTEDSEYEIPACGDQFCYECIESYWVIKMKDASWGLRPAIIDCPVCRAINRDISWITWSGTEARKLYYENAKKRSVTRRTCQVCSNEQTIIGAEQPRGLLELFEKVRYCIKLDTVPQLEKRLEIGDMTGALRYLKRNLNGGDYCNQDMILLLRKILQEGDKDDGELFANKQLAALSICPGTICDSCGSPLCLRCGLEDWHRDKTCLERLRQRLDEIEYFLALPEEEKAGQVNTLLMEADNLRWKLQHCKPCPRCYILVSKEEDGSCNQMRCNNCGFAYCWQCLKEWSSACGFYSCLTEEEEGRTKASAPTDIKPGKTEAGIPDVTKLPSLSPKY